MFMLVYKLENHSMISVRKEIPKKLKIQRKNSVDEKIAKNIYSEFK